MTATHRCIHLVVGLALAVVFVVGCSSTSRAQPSPTIALTSTSAAPATTAVPKKPLLKCPAHVPATIAHHQVRGTASRFVPGYPVELLACRYHGGNQLQAFGSLARSAHFASGELAAELNAAPSELGGPPLRFCPIDFGEKIILIFGYSDRTRLSVSIDMGGCEVAMNGDRSISSTPVAVLKPLEAVLGYDHD